MPAPISERLSERAETQRRGLVRSPALYETRGLVGLCPIAQG